MPTKLKCQLRTMKVCSLYLHYFFQKSHSFMDLNSLKSWVGAQVSVFPRTLKAGRELTNKNSRKLQGQQHSLSSLPAANWVTLPPLLSYWCTFIWYLDSQAFVKRNKRKLNKSFLDRRDGFLDLLTRQIGHCHWRFLFRYSCILAETYWVCQDKVLLTYSMVWSLSGCHVQFWKTSASQEKCTCGCRVVLILLSVTAILLVTPFSFLPFLILSIWLVLGSF